ncbi:MAG: serine/threonine-protein kinase [Candidatus Obscuribacter sp.]|nr:serine/threonine-protein kinase [Candidatus Obscuribacter sp.]
MTDFETAIQNRYRITGELGSGTMGNVYKAVQLATNRPVAIKVLASDLLRDSKSLKRLKREAKALSVLNHTGIVCVYEFDTHSAPVPFMVMEFVPGRSLKAILKSRQLKLEETVNLMLQAAKALSHAHYKGIIHRDVKPANMLIDEERMELKIVDFGIARPASNLTQEQLTMQGEVFGSPLYMSPEQCQGIEIDARSDIYSLGCVLFECLTGHPPYRGISAFDTMTMHLNSAVPKLEDELDLGPYRALATIVEKTLCKKPADRFASMSDLATSLAILKETVVTNAAPQKIEPDKRMPSSKATVASTVRTSGSKTHGIKLLLLVMVGLAAVLASIYAGLSWKKESISKSAFTPKLPLKQQTEGSHETQERSEVKEIEERQIPLEDPNPETRKPPEQEVQAPENGVYQVDIPVNGSGTSGEPARGETPALDTGKQQ